MSNGRTSRLYRALVRDKQIASDSEGFSGYPGNKYPQLFAFYAFPIPGHKPQEVGDAIHAEIERLKKEDISDEELKMIKTRAKANLIRSLGSNEGLAFALGLYQARYDDWRELFRSVDRIEKVTKADIRRVANKTFTPITGRWGLSSLLAGLRERAQGRKEVDSEGRPFKHIPKVGQRSVPLRGKALIGDSALKRPLKRSRPVLCTALCDRRACSAVFSGNSNCGRRRSRLRSRLGSRYRFQSCRRFIRRSRSASSCRTAW